MSPRTATDSGWIKVGFKMRVVVGHSPSPLFFCVTLALRSTRKERGLRGGSNQNGAGGGGEGCCTFDTNKYKTGKINYSSQCKYILLFNRERLTVLTFKIKRYYTHILQSHGRLGPAQKKVLPNETARVTRLNKYLSTCI